ncbi:hypothetical protein J1C56_08915 [Aminobacter anthyllidis]|uniref:Uncharacterized protein n=1 Tax=Aminobacter anthyllidis TaxID=1035067 RepID=A0A9X1A9T6_9HYPH|nr:hypothetical protein [Aminobacter anthyllidis]MBT1155711.1 hypothetical protein [Aminobacter anthyllidis]
MPNNCVPAAAEGLPEINRRRLLLGLASASTAAAVGAMPAPAKAAGMAENPRLLELASELPALIAAYNDARQAQDAVEAKWNAVWPWAPDELTVPGTGLPWSDTRQPGEAEGRIMGGYLWRKGDEFPRRIVVTTRNLDWDIGHAKRHLRALTNGKQKKSGGKALAAWRDELVRLQQLHCTAETYEKECERLKEPARAEHKTKWTVTHKLRDELEDHIAAIMNEPDATMEGLLIKAEALAAWDKSGKDMDKLAIRHGREWHGQIAASILRHAQGGAA